MFKKLLNTTVNIKRPTAETLAATTISASHVPSSAGITCCFLVTISGADPVGSVALIGNVSGVSTTETLTFTAAGFKQSVNQFDAGTLVAVQPSGLTGQIQVEARTPDGQPVISYSDLVTGAPARLDYVRTGLDVGAAGQDATQRLTLFMSPLTTSIQGGDRVVHGSDTYIISPVHSMTASRSAHHWEIPLTKDSRN